MRKNNNNNKSGNNPSQHHHYPHNNQKNNNNNNSNQQYSNTNNKSNSKKSRKNSNSNTNSNSINFANNQNHNHHSNDVKNSRKSNSNFNQNFNSNKNIGGVAEEERFSFAGSRKQQDHHSAKLHRRKAAAEGYSDVDTDVHNNVTGMDRMYLNPNVDDEMLTSINMRPVNARNTQQQQQRSQRDKDKAERSQLVLWRRPFLTLTFCNLELIELARSLGRKLLQRKIWLAVFLVMLGVVSILYKTPGSHQILFEFLRRNTWFVVYWIGLGILSSVGLGTGLHTFILYLGPHIASVTLAAYECNSLNFPKPPYPDDIICPEEPYVKQLPNIWSIMSKVRLEAFLWGAGTALGELPPYFMAKAARLSGYDPDDAKELAEFEALKAKRNAKNLGLVDRGKLFMERVVERIGFFGILACASIPNPLFDLAGITCGHFLVPFWTFFGATLIGKAVIKMHIQKVFVIIAFNETLIEKAVDLLALIPIVGKKLQEPFKGFLNNQKQRLHRHQHSKHSSNSIDAGNLLSKIFELFVICMVCYFIISIINSLAQSYHKRMSKKYSLRAAETTSGSNVTRISLHGQTSNATRKHKKLQHRE